uniref:Integrase, catalytic region, zinc finger, CCHC-type, peptidase aspartic, catalytic n=1 Tax=Tanacetum cinerariifolium TaxID=118510 RepID=A0A699HX83_TANCI|nr:integrase, catalytic region, zinc finger, CCHC-type, peptidase aspartic, catalytic [Tanacetum cinerariifolium]
MKKKCKDNGCKETNPSKEQCDDLINQVNLKYVEISDLIVSLHKKVLLITTLKNSLKKLKGKALADDAITSHSIALEIFNVDVEPLNPRLLSNRSAYSDYLKHTQEEAEEPTGKVFTNIGYTWRPTGWTFTIVGNACPLTRITTTTEVPSRKPIAIETDTPKPVVTLVYSRIPRKSKSTDPGNVKFRNYYVAKIIGYGDYQIRNVTISRVYHMEGLGHNLFSVGQFCDLELEVAFRQHVCFIHNLEGVDLLTGSLGNNLYTLSVGDMMASSHICLLSKASKTKAWLWHRRLSHLNFGAINHLARHGLVREAVATACYTHNLSIIRLRHGKTPYELLHNKPPNISFLHVFGEGNLENIQTHQSSGSLDFEVLIVGYEHVVMNCGSAGIRQHDKSEPVSYYPTD